jgi:hypothetical protein
MTSAFIQKLASQTRCPVCGYARKNLSSAAVGSLDNIQTIAGYECGAIFIANDQTVDTYEPCTSGSELAARLMRIEAQGKEKR